MAATMRSDVIITILCIIAHLNSVSSSCSSLYVTIEDFGDSALDSDNWNGVYTLAPNASVWTTPKQWLKYIHSHWVLSGQNNELLIYQSNDTTSPPINESTTWIHEYDTESAFIRLKCSDTISPTNSPSSAPTLAPTSSPTISDCDYLILKDWTDDDHVVGPESEFFNVDRQYKRFPNNDWSDRPIWQYEDPMFESAIQFDSNQGMGWVVFLNFGEVRQYYTDFLFGVWPPLNTPILFNQTTNGGTPRNLTLICHSSDYPTNSPTLSPSTSPSSTPSTAPSGSPTQSPHGVPTPLPTVNPTASPTIAPSTECEVLQIQIPLDLYRGSNPQCAMDLQTVFGALWLQQNVRSERPSWTLDCTDSNSQYTTACNAGYSGSIFFIENEWEIQIHSKDEDCFERFTVDGTYSHFLPMEAEWTELWTESSHRFVVECFERVVLSTDSPQSDSGALSGTTTETEGDSTWMAIAVILMVAMCILFVVGVWYHRRWRKPVVIYEPNSNKSAQNLELQQVPQAAYLDDDIAEIAPEQQDDEKSPELDGMTDGTRPNGTASGLSVANDPERNPNLQQIQTQQSMRSLGSAMSLMDGMYRSTSTISVDHDGDAVTGGGMEALSPQLEGDEMKNDGDRALDMIAGKGSISVVNNGNGTNNAEELSESELLYGDPHQKTVEGGASDESMEFDEDGGIYSV